MVNGYCSCECNQYWHTKCVSLGSHLSSTFPNAQHIMLSLARCGCSICRIDRTPASQFVSLRHSSFLHVPSTLEMSDLPSLRSRKFRFVRPPCAGISVKECHETPSKGKHITICAVYVSPLWYDCEYRCENFLVCHGFVHKANNVNGFIPQEEAYAQEIDGVFTL